MIKRLAPLAVLAILFATSTARADIGVVVTGEATLQPQLLSHLESWLKQRGFPVYSSALDPDAINTLIDCFVVEDLNCAKKVIEARAKSDTILYARVDVAPSENGKRDISIVGYWVAKGHDTMAERRVCHACTEKQMHGVEDDLMIVLAKDPPTGSHVHVPEPAQAAEATTASEPEAPAMPLTDDEPHRLVPAVVMGVGGVLAITGAVLFATDSVSATGPQSEYRTGRTAGVICMGAGVATAAVGAWLWFHEGAHSAPIASVSHDGAVVGWAARF
jgi:hypothetical protein